MEKPVTKSTKILSVIVGTLLGGFMWRCRGESGFGSSWGLYSVALMIILLIWQVYGRRQGMKFGLIPIGAALAGLGVTGYGTVIEQLSGLVWSDLPFQGEQVYLPVNPFSGAAIIFIMGFTLIPLFSFFIGTLFSEKKSYAIKEYVIAIVLFFGVGYVMKATLAHPVLRLINPEQVDLAARGLADAGYDYASPFTAYMAHFGQRRWTQEIPFFENYYMSIEHVSDLAGVFAMALYPLIRFRDRVAALVPLFINAFTAVCTTVCSLMIAAPFESGFLEGVKCPEVLADGNGWGLWEFATGAAVGFAVMFIIAVLPDRLTSQSLPDKKPLIPSKVPEFLFDLVAVVFIFGVVPARVIGIRFNKLLKNVGVLEDGNTLGTVMIIVLSVAFGLYMLRVLKSNVLDGMGLPLYYDPHRLSFIIYTPYLLMCFVAYFFLNHGYLIFFPYAEMNSFSAALRVAFSGEQITTTVMLITFVILIALWLLLKAKLSEKRGAKA